MLSMEALGFLGLETYVPNFKMAKVAARPNQA